MARDLSHATVDAAVRLACERTREPVTAIAEGTKCRARHIAFDALLCAYPEVRKNRLGKLLHYRNPRAAMKAVEDAKTTQWWDQIAVDEIVGSLVEADYGERAL